MLLNWDVSWHIEGAKHMLGGGSYSTNIFDDNPPMVFWFFIPIVLIHQYTQISLATLCVLEVELLIFVSFYLTNIYLKEIVTDYKIRIIQYSLIILLLFFSDYTFGQRETLLTAFCLPYMTLLVAKMGMVNTIKRPVVEGFLGLWIAIGLAMNPFYALIPLALEVHLYWHKKKIVCFRPESMTLAMSFLTYLVIIFIFYPDYFLVIIPSFIVFSSHQNVSLSGMFLTTTGSLVTLVVSGLIVAISSHRMYREWMISLWYCAALSYLIFIFNQKLWAFHLIPFHIFFNLLCVVIACNAMQQYKSNPLLSWLTGLYAIASLLFSTLHLVMSYTHDYNNYLLSSKVREFISYFEQQKGGELYVFSTELVPAFPLITYSSLNYISPGPGCWLIPALVQNARINTLTGWRLHWVEKYKALFIQETSSDFLTKKPLYVIVDVAKNKAYLKYNTFDYIEFLSQNSIFREQWKYYHLQKTISHFNIYKRSEGT